MNKEADSEVQYLNRNVLDEPSVSPPWIYSYHEAEVKL